MKRLAARIARLLRLPRRRRADVLITVGNRARDEGRHLDAAHCYVNAIALIPDRGNIHVQAGHMFKEARDFDAAQRHYREAERLLPNDADLALQLGHFYKTVDRRDIAEAQYRRAVALAPDWAEPARELAALARDAAAVRPVPAGYDPAPAWELVPGPLPEAPSGPVDQILLRRLGTRRESITEGSFPYLSGVEAIRGICFSDRPLVAASLLIDGEQIHHEAITAHEVAGPVPWKAVFNLWVDLSVISPGPHQIDIVLADALGWTRRRIEKIVVGLPTGRDGLVPSDGLILLPLSDTADDETGNTPDIEAHVRARPSMIRTVDQMRPPPPQRILVLRIDQLGDLVVSLPALRRLRALFPEAQIVGLLGPANADLARSLDLFDEVIEVDVPDDPLRRRRTMTPERQRALAARLGSGCFDIAIDLATSDVSRPLLKLTGARLTFGFDDAASPWLDGGISGSVRDLHGGGEASPHSMRVLALVERLGTLFAPPAPVVRETGLDPGLLAPLGLAPGEPYVVLHAGARVAWSRWPGFVDLARVVLVRHPLRVVLLAEGTDLVRDLPADLRGADGLVLVDRRLSFDILDALLSFAAAFVGNDSGPKHLAALRGTPVVSIHCARIGWAEWGQEQTGAIVSRQVPCAGCAIFHDADECGKEIACVADIGVDEVLAALEAELATRARAE